MQYNRCREVLTDFKIKSFIILWLRSTEYVIFKHIVSSFLKYDGVGIYIIIFTIINTLKFQRPILTFPFSSYDFNRKPLNWTINIYISQTQMDTVVLQLYWTFAPWSWKLLNKRLYGCYWQSTTLSYLWKCVHCNDVIFGATHNYLTANANISSLY